MKATRLVPGMILNPLYNWAAHRRALNEGDVYEQPRELEVEAGYVHDSADVWVLCCPGYMNSLPVCEPADDKCRDRVNHWMQKQRPNQLRNIQNLLDNISTLKDENQKAHIRQLAKAYGLNPGGKPDVPKSEASKKK